MAITLIKESEAHVAEPLKRKVVSFQLKNDEVDRFDELETAASSRNKLYKRDALLRELVGLDEFDLVSEEEWLYFRGQQKAMPQTLKRDLERAGHAKEESSSGYRMVKVPLSVATPRRKKTQGHRKSG